MGKICLRNFCLRKIIIISLLLAIAFIIEIFFTKSILNLDCEHAVLKLELLPIALISLFFGFKLSFLSNLLYICIHIIMEFIFHLHKHELFNFDLDKNHYFELIFLFFVFVIPYLAYSVLGFLYNNNLKNKNNVYQYKNILKNLILVSLIQIISYFLFISIVYYNQPILSLSTKLFYFKINLPPYQLLFIYYLISVILTNFSISIMLYFLIPIFKEIIENFDKEYHNNYYDL
ncbi:MAG: hypothetical protein Q8784_00670 [Vigna little leaf phytoplasma]|nr:hypothetical protein [Vigna little leaf phytoplasma]